MNNRMKENKGGRIGRRKEGWPVEKEETMGEAGYFHPWCVELPKCSGEEVVVMMVTHESS
jgi:hypothetical protein